MNDLMLEHDEDLADFTPRCSNYRSTHIDEPNVSRPLGGAIGAAAGTTSGVA